MTASQLPTLLIDGDMIVHSATIGTEFPMQWDDQNWILSANLEEGRALISDRMSQLRDRFSAGKMIVCFSDPKENFRKEVDPTYKLSRVKARKPITFWPLREWMYETYNCLDRPKLEADDVMGILATSPKTTNPIMISDDKDMLTIPGRLWRGGQLIDISEEEADLKWLTQTLTGDATDGYNGCPGIGPVAAAKILKEPSFDAVVKAYEAKGFTFEDALRSARLARILRYSDWDAKKQKVKLWQPEHIPAANGPQTA